MLIVTLLCFSLWGSIASCSNNEKAADPVKFTVAHEDDGLKFTRLEATQQLSIQAPTTPSVSSDQPWLTATAPTVKAGASHIYVTDVKAAANDGYNDRSATLTVTCGSESKKVKVVQTAGEGIVLVSVTPEKEIGAGGGQITVKFEATSEYKVTASGPVERHESRSLTPGEETFTVFANHGAATRDIDITIALISDESLAISAHLTQAGSTNAVHGLTSIEIARAMTNGINIGNTMEATGGETSWGAELVNREYVHGLLAAGFDAVRIPCSWNIYMDDQNVIDAKWLNRVYEVVGYCIDEGMYVLLNDHWDDGWLENDIPNGYKEEKAKRLTAMWKQISEKMAEFDQRLMFAGLNEPNAESDNAIRTLVKYEQVFVDAVRATGGNNADRILVVQAPNTSLELAMNENFTLPNDPTPDRIMVETHFYGPYQFTLMEQDADWGKTFWFWGKDNHVEGSDRNSTWGEEDWVREQCQLMYNRFTVKGVPTIMGEYGCMVRSELKGGNYWDLHQKSRRDWSECVVRESKLAGCVPFNWDTPGGIVHRHDGHITDQAMVDAIANGAKTQYPF